MGKPGNRILHGEMSSGKEEWKLAECSPTFDKINNDLDFCNIRKPDRPTHEKITNIVRESSRQTRNDSWSKGERFSDLEVKSRQRRKRKLIRGFCCLGWILCCPCWLCGFCLRDDITSWPGDESGFETEMQNDPCWPCFYRTSGSDTDSLRKSSTGF